MALQKVRPSLRRISRNWQTLTKKIHKSLTSNFTQLGQ